MVELPKHMRVKAADDDQDTEEDEDDVLTKALFLTKKKPNHMLVADLASDDSHYVALSPAKMKELELIGGDTVILKGKERAETLCKVMPEKKCPNNQILMNKMARKNLRVELDDDVNLVNFPDVPYALHVKVSPVDDSLHGFVGDVLKTFVNPYFAGAFIPVHEGDFFVARSNQRHVEFQIVKTDPTPFCIVCKDTTITCCSKPVKIVRTLEQRSGIYYEHIGGMDEQITQFREIVELPLRHPQIYKQLGIKPPRGVLLHGPSGSGKTLLARAAANECKAHFCYIDGPEILGNTDAESESNLRKVFEKCEQNSPAVLFIDTLDVIAPRKEKAKFVTQSRVASQLMILMDKFRSRGNTIVIGATDSPDVINPSLRRFGRFDREIEIGYPDASGRFEILKIQTRNMRLDKDVNLERIAKETCEFVGADLASLCLEAALHQIHKKAEFYELHEEKVSDDLLRKLAVSMSDFEAAMRNYKPLAVRRSLEKIRLRDEDEREEDNRDLRAMKKDLEEVIQDIATAEKPNGEWPSFDKKKAALILF